MVVAKEAILHWSLADLAFHVLSLACVPREVDSHLMQLVAVGRS